ncbi:MAG: DUF368 domain-containing protein [Clostridia bacterium]|nr:DUF368 domain-containing protein [Clostridia bacterium]
MGENKEKLTKNASKSRLLPLTKDIAAGFGMGVAFIIPGFSGGSVAAILGIYEKLVGAIADIFKSFKRSIVVLAPIVLGLVLGAVSLMFPLEWALGAFPLPTVCIFVGLAIGGMPTIIEKLKGRITLTNIIAFIIPATLVIGVAFLPMSADKNLFDLSFGGYALLFLIGIIGSAALVIPGISGSMLLLILGYYNPILDLITNNLFKGVNVGVALLVLVCVGVGIIVGFIAISVLMKQLLRKYTRGTYFAIFGFIVGSIPTIFITTVKDFYTSVGVSLPTSVPFWIISVLLLLVGAAMSLSLVLVAKRGRSREE